MEYFKLKRCLYHTIRLMRSKQGILIVIVTVTYLITLYYIFDELPSFSGVWSEITELAVFGDDYYKEPKYTHLYEYNDSDPYDELSYEIIKPWLHVRARIDRKKRLTQRLRNGLQISPNKPNRIRRKKRSPWTRECPPRTTMKIHHDQVLGNNLYTPGLSEFTVNFTILKSKLNRILRLQKPLIHNNMYIKSLERNLETNNKLKQCGYRNKVFGIGMYKTGTTSLSLALSALGYRDTSKTSIYKWLKQYPCNYGHWYLILRHYYDLILSLYSISSQSIFNDIIHRSLISYNFGDFPMLFFWQFFDIWYPNSKFILTKRSSSVKFVNSVMKFCLQLQECMQYKLNENENGFGLNHFNWSQITIDEYKWNKYDDISGIDLANYFAMLYDLHNERIINYFKVNNKMDQLLIINIDEYKNNHNKNQWKDIMQFLQCKNDTIQHAKYPHVNPTKNEYSIANLLPNNYNLDWKTYFNNKIPIMRTTHEPYRKIYFTYQDGDYNELV